MLLKVSVDDIFMDYFQNMSSASGGGGALPDSTGAQPLDPAGGLQFQRLLICPPLEKILRAPMYKNVRKRVPTHWTNNKFTDGFVKASRLSTLGS